ncbi:MAG: N-acetyltransferase family protein [Acidimicrobiia bacterium]
MEAARPALPADRPRVVELAGAAISELAVNRGGALWSRREARAVPVDASIDEALVAADRHLVVGTIDGVVVGYGLVRVEVLRDGGRLGVLEDLYVEPDARGVGVGEAIMGIVLEWCGAQGCFGVDSLVLPGDRAAKNFFESFGLVARAIVVHRALDA